MSAIPTLRFVLAAALCCATAPGSEPVGAPAKFRFQHHVIDADLPAGMYAQTGLADLDGDGRPEFVMGRRDGELYVYKHQAAD
ncbi:MAG TPA: hypothetical protein VML55_24285, partial [Planctomycetaceae bacterium]|nr:hypothetical protein [Planctomycetaceae bacterium]